MGSRVYNIKLCALTGKGRLIVVWRPYESRLSVHKKIKTFGLGLLDLLGFGFGPKPLGGKSLMPETVI